jgi:internalin A
MIVDFLEVDSLVDDPETGEKVGVKKLKDLIAETAKDLPQMGMWFNRDWREARDELLGMKEPRIAYQHFADVCQRHHLDAIASKTLADLMNDLGYIVYYGDDEHLKDDVVLQPEWLTKAIGFILEDRTTRDMDGILPDNRLREVWHDHPFENETRYDPEIYPFFLRLMEKYDVSYRLEDGNASLVAQHVPQVRPQLPWLPEEDPAPSRRRISIVCVVDEEPPGLVPWMIVQTHDYAYEHRGSDQRLHRLHWQKGMFLQNKRHGEAMLELRGREFHICVEAVWPEYFMNVLKMTLHKLIRDNWPGLEGRYHFAVPCPSKRDDGTACDGRFDIDAVRQFLNEGDHTIRCQGACCKRQDIVELLYGFEEKDTQEQLARIEKKVELGFEQVQMEVEELDSRLAYYVMGIMTALANEAKEGPRMFTIEPVDGNWRQLISKRYRLSLWCEAEGCQHPVLEPGKGVYEFSASRGWVTRVAPYVNFIAGVLRTMAPMALPAAALILGDEVKIDDLGIKRHLELVKEATGALLKGKIEVSDETRLRQETLSEEERSGILALLGRWITHALFSPALPLP